MELIMVGPYFVVRPENQVRPYFRLAKLMMRVAEDVA